MRYLILSLFLFLHIIAAQATHIVGGEFELTHISDASYRLNLHLYFDKVNGNPGALDQTIVVSIFDKATNIRKMDIQMSNPNITPVAYTAIACTNASLSTDRIVYSKLINLPENLFNNPSGYYVVWERCCRNRTISNIVFPDGAAQTFYMEFPPVTRNGVRFINSSPQLFPPLSDYACINDLFYYEFGGKDPDGDSLVYEMITPFNGHSTQIDPMPLPFPAPFNPITWNSGLNEKNQIPGSPPVNINSSTGQLTVRPTALGLFVFGVKCSEYRDNQKIGEVRRDFQLLVLNCPKNDQPVINIRQAGKNTSYKEGDIIKVTANENRCLDLFFTDTDPNESLTIEAKPINFTLPDQIISLRNGIVNRNGVKDTLKTSACFPACLTSASKIYIMDFIVSDDGGSLPKKDTVRVSFQIDPVPNEEQTITTTAPATVIRPKLGEIINFDVLGADVDNDIIALSVTTEDFNIANQGIVFPANSAAGKVTSPFKWEIDCRALSQPLYTLKFVATTQSCGQTIVKTTIIEVRPEYQNQKPSITAGLAGKTIDVQFGTAYTDTIFGLDPDLNFISLEAMGDGFDMDEVGMQFSPTSGNGQAKALFSWTPACNLIADKQQYKVNFKVTETTCQPFPPEEISVTFNVVSSAPTAFIPANIFTPNNDGLNDTFELPTLPPDICTSVFLYIRIFNRWGGQVYESSSRSFAWDGKNVTDGVYFYHIRYTDKEFKGPVTLLR